MIPSSAFNESLKIFLDPVSHLMNDPSVGEIMINGPFEIWAERKGLIEKTDASFKNKAALFAALTNIAQFVGRPLNPEHPILEAHLPDGSRVEAVLDPVAENGPIASIRRFSHTPLTLDMLIKSSSINVDAAEYLRGCVDKKHNIVISGGTGTGKTSLLNAVSSMIRDDERIVVIEDTREVRLQKPHVVYLETRSADERGRGRITIRDLLRATLRLRPDRIVVGEIRGAEAMDLIQAMTSGHGGSMTTAHADTPEDAMRRLETMAMMDDLKFPLFALRAQIASAVDVIIQIERCANGKRRVKEISRVDDLSESGDYVTRSVFVLNQEDCLTKIEDDCRSLT